MKAIGALIVADLALAREAAFRNVLIMASHREQAVENYLAVAFILGADKIQYGQLIKDLESSYLTGSN
jgi:hypothetical protein